MRHQKRRGEERRGERGERGEMRGERGEERREGRSADKFPALLLQVRHQRPDRVLHLGEEQVPDPAVRLYVYM
jgi:hypothetical protein